MTREEDIWQCSQCGTFQGRHDMWTEGDICGDCDSKILTSEEQIKLDSFILTKREDMKERHELTKINGGFCNIDLVCVDADTITLDCSIGVSDGYSRHVTKVQIELDRNTFEIDDERAYQRITQEMDGEEIIENISD